MTYDKREIHSIHFGKLSLLLQYWLQIRKIKEIIRHFGMEIQFSQSNYKSGLIYS